MNTGRLFGLTLGLAFLDRVQREEVELLPRMLVAIKRVGLRGRRARVAKAVAQAAMDSGVATRPIEDFDEYRLSLRSRLNPTTAVLTRTYEDAKKNPQRVVFAEAEEEVILRAAIQLRDFGYGKPILVGRTKAVADKMIRLIERMRKAAGQ